MSATRRSSPGPAPRSADGECLRCPFVARAFIERRRKTYKARYHEVPSFRAAIHYGEIVAGEIGDVRREIAYVGDTLNVAARLLDAAKELGHDVLVSDELLAQGPLPGRPQDREAAGAQRARPRRPARRVGAGEHVDRGRLRSPCAPARGGGAVIRDGGIMELHT